MKDYKKFWTAFSGPGLETHPESSFMKLDEAKFYVGQGNIY